MGDDHVVAEPLPTQGPRHPRRDKPVSAAHNRSVTLPPELLQAISAEEGGKVALIIGAGCSFEPPTDLPLSRGLSEDAHARLVADAILAAGDCADPSDLSCVADVVFDKTTHQDALVDRFPLARLRNAAPNDGYLIAVALLREHAICDLLRHRATIM